MPGGCLNCLLHSLHALPLMLTLAGAAQQGVAKCVLLQPPYYPKTICGVEDVSAIPDFMMAREPPA